nr:calcium-translocating P-type ATPase, PMCA-type [uncultured Acetobacterium sp.]
METEKLYECLETGKSGLTETEAESRRQLYGSNKINKGKKRTLVKKIWEQLNNIMVLILSVAAIIAFFAGDIKSTIIIIFVIIMNTILGLVQEGKAEKAMETLQSMSSPEAEVLRDDKARMIKAEELTIGDLVLLDAGDHIPADLRLIEAINLKIEEASLTGESVPVEKETQPLDKGEIVIGDRKNMAFMGSTVTYGRGAGIVTAIGMDTEMGKIAECISENNESQKTPLQIKLAEMSKYISIIIVIASVVIFITGLLWGRSFFDMFLTAVSLAVAAIPEGLPAIVTIVLALGVQKMARKNTIIRKLPAVETLGSAEVICTDKTGTLTKNEMTVVKVYLNQGVLEPDLVQVDQIAAKRSLEGMLLCNDTRVSAMSDDSEEMTGDPTETALVKFAHRLNYNKNNIDTIMPRVTEIPFDSDRKLMTTVNRLENRYTSYTKGALDILLDKCNRILDHDVIRNITIEDREMIVKANSLMAKNALRVIAFGYKELEAIPQENQINALEDDLVFIGFVGMIDPPRPEVRVAVQKCREAGIKPVMITGDHKDTASAIARELGILKDGESAIEGSVLQGMSNAELLENVENYSVYARVSTEHKVRIVKAWQEKGKITAMTGDGVNDAPALKSADIGIGMGITGSDVAKGVSDMVLADDNFATIVSAIEEGRKIYSNIRKAVHFLLSTHLGEVIALFIATMLNWVILYPIHLLWVNLIIDTFPALALGMEKPEENIMRKNPRKSKQNFFAEGLGVNIVSQGMIKGLLVLTAYYVALNIHSQEVAVTTAFATLGLVQLCHAFTIRSETKSILKMGFFTNAHLIVAVAIAALLQVSVIIIPAFNELFKVKQLYWEEWIITIIASIVIIPIVEIQKRWFGKNRH